MSGRRIIMAAVCYKTNRGEIIVASERPGRHHTAMHGLHVLTGHQTGADDEQGFITSDGFFVGREEAYRIASEAGQIVDKHGPEDVLFSEDMW
jgi:hypothetical protein